MARFMMNIRLVIVTVIILVVTWFVTGWIMGCTFVYLSGSGNSLSDIGGDTSLRRRIEYEQGASSSIPVIAPLTHY
jgi:hypothetical protein